MAELLLVNPHRRSRKARKNPSKRRKGRMPPALARYWATHSRNPSRKRRVHRNPSHRAAHHAHKRKRRSNPSFRGLGGRFTNTIFPTVKQGAVGAVGAIGNDLLMGQLLTASWMPSVLASGIGATLTKGLGALVVGLLGGFVWRGKGRDLGEGAMTVVLHEALKAQVQQILPAGWTLGEYMTFAPTVGYTDQGQGMGAYLTGPGAGGLGEYISSDIGNPDFYGQSFPGQLSLS